jgi:hypothetical protein
MPKCPVVQSGQPFRYLRTPSVTAQNWDCKSKPPGSPSNANRPRRDALVYASPTPIDSLTQLPEKNLR